ncbi:membrane protein [Mycobacterium phage SheaKeira]|nr:membrane protein [Mycobacterium phage SheaKeira]
MEFLLHMTYAVWWFIMPLVALSWFLYILESRKEKRDAANKSEVDQDESLR